VKSSLWQTYSVPSFPSVPTDKLIECDCCIVGTGIGGLTAAYQLAKAGKSIVLVCDGNFASGQSALTTAQINTIHDDTWSLMRDIHGEDGIGVCAQGYKEALQFIRNVTNKENIECHLENVDSYIFNGKDEKRDILGQEHKLARVLDLKVSLLDTLPTFPVEGPLLCYHDQAQFHPLMYLSGLANSLSVMPNVKIYTHTRIHEIDDSSDRIRLSSKDGASLVADSVIMATNVPIHHRLIPHEALAPYRSYVIALPLERGSLPYGQYSDTEDPYHYVRIIPNNRQEYNISAEFDCLLVGGEDHRVADVDDSDKRFSRLYTWAKEFFPIKQNISYMWSAQTIETFDGMPLFGKLSSDSKNIFMITGDSGTGMTHATLGGLITADLALDKPNEMSAFFRPDRSRTKCISRWISENAVSAKHYIDWLTPGEIDSEEDIKPGSGAIMRVGLTKCAVYKDPNGKCTRLSAVCPHLKALVHWNPVEHTWDCPAHGSRFTIEGKILTGPAADPLEVLE